LAPATGDHRGGRRGIIFGLSGAAQRDAWTQGYLVGRLSAIDGGAAALAPVTGGLPQTAGQVYGVGWGHRGFGFGGFLGFLFLGGLLFFIFGAMRRAMMWRHWVHQYGAPGQPGGPGMGWGGAQGGPGGWHGPQGWQGGYPGSQQSQQQGGQAQAVPVEPTPPAGAPATPPAAAGGNEQSA
jgi:hypothetical protein